MKKRLTAHKKTSKPIPYQLDDLVSELSLGMRAFLGQRGRHWRRLRRIRREIRK